jgi:hypothetical protein
MALRHSSQVVDNLSPVIHRSLMARPQAVVLEETFEKCVTGIMALEPFG